jgi:hypothetical protein
MPRKPSDTVQLKLRFSDALRRQLEKTAAANDRSMNSEIVKRLERSFRSEQLGLLITIMNATIGGRQPKWSTPENGREMTFTPELKKLMAERIAGFIASLPEAEVKHRLSEEEFAAIDEMLTRHEQQGTDRIKGRK